jgi:hypothetical protein
MEPDFGGRTGRGSDAGETEHYASGANGLFSAVVTIPPGGQFKLDIADELAQLAGCSENKQPLRAGHYLHYDRRDVQYVLESTRVASRSASIGRWRVEG